MLHGRPLMLASPEGLIDPMTDEVLCQRKELRLNTTADGGPGGPLNLNHLKLTLRLSLFRPKPLQLRFRRSDAGITLVHASTRLVDARLDVADLRAQRQ